MSEQERPQVKKRLGILAEPSLMAQVDKIGREVNLSTRTKTLCFLTKLYEDTQHSSNGLPIATFEEINRTEAPIVLYGIPGSGKSCTLDIFLKECQKRSLPFLLFNSDNRDHAWIQNVLAWTDVVSLRWLDSPGEYIVRLDHDLAMRKTTVYQISQTILRLENDKRLEPWTLCFEEAHDYYKIDSFASILRRMRKSARKLIVVSTESDLFKMCKSVHPIPF